MQNLNTRKILNIEITESRSDMPHLVKKAVACVSVSPGSNAVCMNSIPFSVMPGIPDLNI